MPIVQMDKRKDYRKTQAERAVRKKVTVYLTDHEYERLESVAYNRKDSISSVVRKALLDKLKMDERKMSSLVALR